MADLVTAAEIARQLNVSRDWVYAHANELGAIKMGAGPKPRLRFDPEWVRGYLAASSRPVTPSPGRPTRSGLVGSHVVADLDKSLDHLPESWKQAVLSGRKPT
jgi:hypothetical protein